MPRLRLHLPLFDAEAFYADALRLILTPAGRDLLSLDSLWGFTDVVDLWSNAEFRLFANPLVFDARVALGNLVEPTFAGYGSRFSFLQPEPPVSSKAPCYSPIGPWPVLATPPEPAVYGLFLQQWTQPVLLAGVTFPRPLALTVGRLLTFSLLVT